MFFSTQAVFPPPNPGKVHFEGLVHLLIYIRDNKNLGLKYYAKIYYAPLSVLFRQYIIKTDNQLIVLSDSILKDCPDTVIIKGSYIFFIKVDQLIIAHYTQVPGQVAQSSSESEYNATCTIGMALASFRIINNELLNKYSYIDLVFKLNGPLYVASIWVPNQSWYNSVMTECMTFLENM